MTCYRLDLAYDGAGFRGYARQDGMRTVQGELERALTTVLGHPIETAVAGRTDAGVHARGQVVSFDADTDDVAGLTRSLNGLLGPEIAVTCVAEAAPDFHARFSAHWRRYRYTIDETPGGDPLSRHQAWAIGRSLDLDAMTRVAEAMIGEHDFGSFCRSVAGGSSVRKVTEALWERGDHGLLLFWIQANAFCQQMVRSIVGYSYDVGRGFAAADGVDGVLTARDRSSVATLAPPHGLVLWEVGY